jgi:hypothetical protein
MREMRVVNAVLTAKTCPKPDDSLRALYRERLRRCLKINRYAR